jgi:hypothetical protein
MADVLPRLPERGALIRFLAERPALPLHEAADLLGWSSQQLVENLRTEEAFLPDGTIKWSEVAYWLLDVWPRAILLKALGNRATLIPRGLHLEPVPWNLPIYLVRAMKVHAVLNREDNVHGASVEDHVAKSLHLLLDDDTIAFFCNDAEFLAAFEYPDVKVSAR